MVDESTHGSGFGFRVGVAMTTGDCEQRPIRRRLSAIPAFDTIKNRKSSPGPGDDSLHLERKVLRSAVTGVEISETARVRVKARSGDVRG